MKKIIALSLSLTSVLGTVMLSSCSRSKKEQVLIYSTAEEERIAFMQEELNAKFPNYNIVIQEIGTGALVSKMQGEGSNTECDIIHELEITNMETLLAKDSNLFYSLDEYDFDKFTETVLPYDHRKYAPECMTYCAVVYNKKVLNERGLPIPTTYNDLLDSKYEGLISMPNPKSSGTGYAFYNGLVSALGNDAAMSYFDSLNSNIKEYTTSGSAPIKSADRGEIAIGFAMLWQCVEYSKKNSDLEYTYLDLGCPYNLYDMAIINGHQTRTAVKEVFDFIFNELNQKDVEKFVPDACYKVMNPEIEGYPTNITPINMSGVCDPVYKKTLLDAWKY